MENLIFIGFDDNQIKIIEKAYKHVSLQKMIEEILIDSIHMTDEQRIEFCRILQNFLDKYKEIQNNYYGQIVIVTGQNEIIDNIKDNGKKES